MAVRETENDVARVRVFADTDERILFQSIKNGQIGEYTLAVLGHMDIVDSARRLSGSFPEGCVIQWQQNPRENERCRQITTLILESEEAFRI